MSVPARPNNASLQCSTICGPDYILSQHLRPRITARHTMRRIQRLVFIAVRDFVVRRLRQIPAESPKFRLRSRNVDRRSVNENDRGKLLGGGHHVLRAAYIDAVGRVPCVCEPLPKADNGSGVIYDRGQHAGGGEWLDERVADRAQGCDVRFDEGDCAVGQEGRGWRIEIQNADLCLSTQEKKLHDISEAFPEA